MSAFVLILAVAVMGLALLGREAAPDAWALPLAARIGLAVVLAALGAWSAARRRDSGARAASACLAILSLCAVVGALRVRTSPESWHADEDLRLRQRFETVRTQLAQLETRARDIAADAETLLARE